MNEPTHAPAPPVVQQARRRDSRVDFLRGLALLVIAGNHIRGNSLSMLTPLAWGYSDMAEWFVCLSGLVTLPSLERARTRGGAIAVLRKVSWRLAQIYGAYVVFGTLLVWLARYLGPGLFREEISASLLLDSALEVPRSVAGFQGRVSHLSILPLYLGLLTGVGALWGVRSPRWWPVLGVSLLLYGLTQLAPKEFCLPESWEQALYFNPMAWQVLFIGGGTWGLLADKGLVKSIPMAWIPWLGLAVLVALWGGDFCGVSDDWPHGKANLSWPRLVHFLALAGLLWPLLSDWRGSLERGWCGLLTVCGRHSLLVYCVGGLLSAWGTWQRSRLSASVGVDLLVTTLVCGGCVGVALLAEAVSRRIPRLGTPVLPGDAVEDHFSA